AVALEQIRAWRAGRERERLARDARALRVTLSHIVETMESGLLVVDAKGFVTAANPAAERVLGEPRDALRGRPLRDWFPRGDGYGLDVPGTLVRGERVRGAEAVAVRRDGRYVPVGLSTAPLRGVEGTRIGAVAIFQDLSEVKQLQRQVLQTE